MGKGQGNLFFLFNTHGLVDRCNVMSLMLYKDKSVSMALINEYLLKENGHKYVLCLQRYQSLELEKKLFGQEQCLENGLPGE